MTVDREQVRRDAEQYLDAKARNVTGEACARHCLVLLAELEQAERRAEAWRERALTAEPRVEQAERERDEWMTPFDGSGIEWHESLPSLYTYQASDFSKLVRAVHEYESRALAAEAQLAKVPALVEAGNVLAQSVRGEYGTDAAPEWNQALASYEQAQEQR